MIKPNVKFLYKKSVNMYFYVNKVEVFLNNYGDGCYHISSSSAAHIDELLERAMSCIINHQNIQFIFSELGTLNTLRLFQNFFFDEFLNYFEWAANEVIAKPFSNGYYNLFYNITGMKTQLDHEFTLKICIEMRHSYNKVLQQWRSKDCKKITKTEQYEDIDQNRIKITCFDFINNCIYVKVNAYSFPIKMKNAQLFSTKKLFDACIAVSTAIRNNLSISMLISELGSTLIYNIMYAICPDETLLYFKVIADRLTNLRERIYPVKMLKSMKLKSKPCSDTSPILSQILDLLEHEAKKQGEQLIKGNIAELQKESKWNIYYDNKLSLYQQVYKFSTIANIFIAEEFRTYLRDKARIIGYENIQTLHRVYNDIVAGISALPALKSDDGLHSITDISYPEIIQMRAILIQQKKYSPSTFCEIVIYMRNYFSYFALCKNIDIPNPFDKLLLPSKHQFVKNTEPISKDALDILYDNFKEMPQHIQLAFLIYLETGARGNDVCNMIVRDLIKDPHTGKDVLRLTLRKTGTRKKAANRPDYVMHEITLELANMIKMYIDDYSEYRNALNTDLILVYPVPNKRENSKRFPKVLSTESYNDNVGRILLSCGAYKPDGSIEKATSRQLRAELGRRLFKEGKTASEVAAKLGNTPTVALQHYNKMERKDECENYNNLYNDCFNIIFENRNNPKIVDIKCLNANKEMFGSCSIGNCSNKNDCRTCIIRKERTPI